jgi:signal peptidase II
MGTGRGFGGKRLFFLLAALGLGADLATKEIVFDLLEARGERVVVVPGFFYLDQVTNPGGVFGLGQGLTTPLTIARAVALFVVLAFVRTTPREDRLHLVSFGLLFAGAAGNLYDNLTNEGHVRDFLDFYLRPPDRWHYPTFNLADAMICVGAGLLLLGGFRSKKAPALAEGTKGA